MISVAHVRDVIWRNMFLMVVIGIGACSTALWAAGNTEYGPFGIAFIIAGAVGVYMMVTTHKISVHLHERLDETNVILSSHTNLLQEMGSSLKGIVSSQKELVSSQKEIMSSLQDLASSQKEIASSQKETSSTLQDLASSQKEMSSTLKDISKKLDK